MHGREEEEKHEQQEKQHEDRNSQVQDPGPAGPLPRRGRRPAVRMVVPIFLMLACPCPRPPPLRPPAAILMARARVRAGKLALVAVWRGRG